MKNTATIEPNEYVEARRTKCYSLLKLAESGQVSAPEQHFINCAVTLHGGY